jgi:hypothetical protein
MMRSEANMAFSANVTSLPTASTRIMVSEPWYVWGQDVRKRLEELIRLPVGWDGYSGVPVSLENAMFAWRMLEAVLGVAAASPQVVPGSSGDLQIEWHTLSGDVELHVQGPNRVHAWRRMADAVDDGEELKLTNDFATVAVWLKEITEPSLAAQPAAA